MPDFYVNVSTGNDASPGDTDRPLRTITRAIELASEEVGATGTIFVAAGVYESPNERFPMEIPPMFALQGESRDRTRIRFASETRMMAGGTQPFFGAIAVVVGSTLRRVTVEADPLTYDGGCYTSWGIHVINNGSIVEDVVVQPTEPFELHRSGYIAEGFGTGIVIDSSDAVLRRLELKIHSSVVVRGNATITDSAFRSSEISFGSGSHAVRGCTFTHYARARTLQRATITFGWFGRYSGTTDFGPNNTVDRSFHQAVIDCHRGNSANIISNDFAAYYAFYPFDLVRIRAGAAPTFRANNIGPGPKIQVDPGATPLFEANTFRTHMIINGSPDFGGGARGSRGSNHFGPISSHVTLSGRRPPVKIDLPGGGIVYATNNYWPSGNPMESLDFTPGTDVRTDGAMSDTVTE